MRFLITIVRHTSFDVVVDADDLPSAIEEAMKSGDDLRVVDEWDELGDTHFVLKNDKWVEVDEFDTLGDPWEE